MLCGCDLNRQITNELNNVLQTFGTSIPEEQHYFVVIPAFSCLGCVQFTWFYVDSIIVTGNLRNISIIDGFGGGKDPFAKQIDCDIYYDNSNLLNTIPYLTILLIQRLSKQNEIKSNLLPPLIRVICEKGCKVDWKDKIKEANFVYRIKFQGSLYYFFA